MFSSSDTNLVPFYFFYINVGVGRTELKRVEMQEKILDAIRHSKQTASVNHEDSTI